MTNRVTSRVTYNDKVTFNDLNLIKGNIYTLINEAVTYISNHYRTNRHDKWKLKD